MNVTTTRLLSVQHFSEEDRKAKAFGTKVFLPRDAFGTNGRKGGRCQGGNRLHLESWQWFVAGCVLNAFAAARDHNFELYSNVQSSLPADSSGSADVLRRRAQRARLPTAKSTTIALFDLTTKTTKDRCFEPVLFPCWGLLSTRQP